MSEDTSKKKEKSIADNNEEDINLMHVYDGKPHYVSWTGDDEQCTGLIILIEERADKIEAEIHTR